MNENFKTVVKTISGIDHTDDINKFGDQINDIVKLGYKKEYDNSLELNQLKDILEDYGLLKRYK